MQGWWSQFNINKAALVDREISPFGTKKLESSCFFLFFPQSRIYPASREPVRPDRVQPAACPSTSCSASPELRYIYLHLCCITLMSPTQFQSITTIFTRSTTASSYLGTSLDQKPPSPSQLRSITTSYFCSINCRQLLHIFPQSPPANFAQSAAPSSYPASHNHHHPLLLDQQLPVSTQLRSIITNHLHSINS